VILNSRSSLFGSVTGKSRETDSSGFTINFEASSFPQTGGKFSDTVVLVVGSVVVVPVAGSVTSGTFSGSPGILNYHFIVAMFLFGLLSTV